jgi:hypothetical protein
MDASSESSVISGFSGKDWSSHGELAPPSAEGLAGYIVAAKPNKETVC